jgi:hypothetical protein
VARRRLERFDCQYRVGVNALQVPGLSGRRGHTRHFAALQPAQSGVSGDVRGREYLYGHTHLGGNRGQSRRPFSTCQIMQLIGQRQHRNRDRLAIGFVSTIIDLQNSILAPAYDRQRNYDEQVQSEKVTRHASPRVRHEKISLAPDGLDAFVAVIVNTELFS